MEPAAWTVDGEATVGVVDPASRSSGGEATAAPARDAIDRLESLQRDDLEVITGDPNTVLESAPSFVVAGGQSALSALVRTAAPTDVPVLPVDAGRGVRSVPLRRLEAAVEAIVAGDATRREHPVLTVDGDGVGPERALFDVTLVTDEPARISEYAVYSRDDRVERFRADGVVVGTPAGSRGYARAARGPLLSSAIGGVVVVPIAPFVTRTDRWLLPDDDVRLSVERDEGDVALCVDDVTVDVVPPESTLSVAAGSTLSTLVVPDSLAFYGDAPDARSDGSATRG